MKFVRTLLTNHPLVNILFSVVLVMGTLSYLQMPREQDPEINFNFVNIQTVLPGATASDVEQLVTGPLEDALRNVQDIKFVRSSSRENISDILVRFRELSEKDFDKRITDLRREIQSKANDELPQDAEDPYVLEITSSNGFPTAMVLVVGQADDERLRRQGKMVKEDLERVTGVDRVRAFGFNEPELQIEVIPQALAAQGITATDVADQLRASYRDTSAGKLIVGNEAWLLRIQGKTADPDELASFLIARPGSPQSKIRLDTVAKVRRGRKDAIQQIKYDGRPAITMSISKVSFSNTLDLVDRINAYVDKKNVTLAGSGIRLVVADDQTVQTRSAISVMQTNAALGLILVLGVCWLFLGIRIASFVTLGIAFSISGTFWLLNSIGITLNVMVLLGIVIVLGMLVDDAVVVVEAMYYRLQRGQEALSAALDALREVSKPVTSAVFTTISAFAPLMLLPGIVGKFMMIVPLVVTVGLLISLVEAFWILPSHVIGSSKAILSPDKQLQHWRGRWTHKVRIKYTRALSYVFRRPIRFFTAGAAAFALSVVAITSGMVKVDFFASDPLRIFYVNVDMPPGSPIENTLAQTERIRKAVQENIHESEIRAITSMAGLKFTEVEALFGDHYGQIQVSLNPKKRNDRTVREVSDGIRNAAFFNAGNAEITFFVVTGGPPVESDIDVKIRADNYNELRAAADQVKDIVARIEGVRNVSDDDVPGRNELTLTLDIRAIRQAGLSPGSVARLFRLHNDGEIIAFTRDQGEKIELRVRGPRRVLAQIDTALDDPIVLPEGGTTTFRALAKTSVHRGSGTIKHHNYRRSISVKADLGENAPNAVAANDTIRSEWAKIQSDFTDVDLEFAGALDDIQESLDAMLLLLCFGLGLIYLILATQFRSYFQPLLIIATVPMAFTGVVFGLLITQYTLSLFTMYGIVALTGIAVNAAIVLIDAANTRIAAGMRPLHLRRSPAGCPHTHDHHDHNRGPLLPCRRPWR